MKLRDERKVVGNLVNGLFLDLEVEKIILICISAGDWKKAIVITDLYYSKDQIRKGDYKSLKFIFVSAFMLWG